MKFTNKILAVSIGCAILAQSALAGSLGFDPYNTLRTAMPTNSVNVITAAVAPNGTYTNPPLDTIYWQGDFKVDVVTCTNSAANTVKLNINASTDCTNWYQVTNISLASAATLLITNAYVLSAGSWYYNTNFYTSNYLAYPFSIVTPNAASALWNTTYNPENPYTNSTITLNGNGLTELGIHSYGPAGRYLQFVYSVVITPFVTTSPCTP